MSDRLDSASRAPDDPFESPDSEPSADLVQPSVWPDIEPDVETDGAVRVDDDLDGPPDELLDEPDGGVDPADRPSIFVRAGRRIVRRPLAWARRPWTEDRIIKFAFTVVALGVTTYVMANVVHLSVLPSRDLVFDDTTPTGGDFGAHVWGPAYLRDHLLGSLRMNGWSMDWYAGFPAYRFYMVLPALMAVLVDLILPYGIALKLTSVIGLITLPAACWAFGRLSTFRYPMPELLAFGGLAFALDESFSIYGGNLKSTMAGEFSFSIALSIAMLGLGVLANGLRTGRYRVWAAVLIAAACVSHGVVMIAFVIPAAIVFSLIWIDRTRFRYAWTVGLTSVLLLSWWVLPFIWDHEYQTDMKYGELTNWWEMYFPLTVPLDIVITALAIAGFIFAILRRNLDAAALGVLGLVLAAGIYVTKDSLPVLGLLWNPRVLPGFYLVRYLLMMYGVYHLLALFWNAVRDRRANAEPSAGEATALALVPALAVLLVLGFLFQELPGDGTSTLDDGSVVYSWGPFEATSTNRDAEGDGWSRYNFRGYEGRDDPNQGIAYYTEYRNVVNAMQSLGDDPNHGCGRALWENSADNGQYGTTMALMLLPFWTDGCIASMEGLFFEASGTTPYHFLTTSAMSKQSSNPVRELRYTDNDAEVGVDHLQDLGVRYTMVRTDEAKAEAAAQPELTLVASSDPWEIYEVANSDIVVGLDTQPVVVEERLGDGAGVSDRREYLLEIGTSWFQHPEDWAAMPAQDGPDEWQRIDVTPDLDRRLLEGDPNGPRVDIVLPAEPIEPVPLSDVEVTNVEMGESSISFDVDQTGVPVLVKVSYFPNWEASGADGPYRIGPNMMVVIPTENHVELEYGRTPIDYLSILLTFLGIGLCFWWRREGDIVHAGPTPTFGRRDDPTKSDGFDDNFADSFDDNFDDSGAATVPARDAWTTAMPDGNGDRSGDPDDLWRATGPIALDASTTSTPSTRVMTPTVSQETTGSTGSVNDRPMSVLDEIVKAYDVRGTVPDQLHGEVAHALGVGFARFAGTDRIVVGRDMRRSGVDLVAEFARGVQEQGVDVIDLGLASTDLLYFAAGSLDMPGAMFTASHNPAQYNGVKFCLAGARPVGIDSGLAEVRATASTVLDGVGPRPAERSGSYSERDLLTAFADHVISFVDVDRIRPLRVVADTANGMGGLVVPAVFDRIHQIELEVMYGELDGTFPNHPADPLQPANQRDLRARVVTGNFDLGLAFDGDADRVFMVDEQGVGLSGSTTTALLAAAVLRSNPGATILHNLICSRAVPEVVEELGGTPVRTKVGHSYIKQIMAETGAAFGGEHSAHYYFADNYRADSGLIASMLLIGEISRTGQDLSVLRKPYERYAASGEINTQVDDPAQVIDAVSAVFADREQDRLDGLSVDCGDWWFNLRPSNTEPLLRLNLEAVDRGECDDRVADMLALITQS